MKILIFFRVSSFFSSFLFESRNRSITGLIISSSSSSSATFPSIQGGWVRVLAKPPEVFSLYHYNHQTNFEISLLSQAAEPTTISISTVGVVVVVGFVEAEVGFVDDAEVGFVDDADVGFVDDADVGLVDDAEVGFLDDAEVGFVDDSEVGFVDDAEVGFVDDSEVGFLDEDELGFVDDAEVGFVNVDRVVVDPPPPARFLRIFLVVVDLMIIGSPVLRWQVLMFPS